MQFRFLDFNLYLWNGIITDLFLEMRSFDRYWIKIDNEIDRENLG